MNYKSIVVAVALGGLTPWFAWARATPADTATAPTPVSYTDGEVKKIDTEQGKITLKHGPIDNLGMPGMTMVFRTDPALVANFKPGSLVRFKADRVDGGLKVIELVAR